MFRAITLLLALSACASADDPYAGAKKRVADLLKDPSSAEFSDVSEKNGVVCGYVNSKNGFGAFSGKQAFIVKDEHVFMKDNMDPLKFVPMVGYCSFDFYSAYHNIDVERDQIDAQQALDHLNALTPD